MTDIYVPSAVSVAHGTYTATNDTNAIELARLLGITMASDGTYTLDSTAAHPDFNKISGAARAALARELSKIVTAT